MNYTEPMFCLFPFGTYPTMEFLSMTGFESGAVVLLPPVPSKAFELFFKGKSVLIDGKHVIIMYANFHLIEKMENPKLISTMISAVYSGAATIWFVGTEKRLQMIFKKLELYCPKTELYVHRPSAMDAVHVITKPNQSTFHFSQPLPKEAFASLC